MNKKYYLTLSLAVFLSCWIPVIYYYLLADPKIQKESLETKYDFEYVKGAIQPIPRSLTIDKDWMLLGKALFHSTLLSKDNSTSCASCHMVDFGGDDGFPVSLGVGSATGTRNSPTVLNSIFNFRQFWDGRVGTLEEQAPIPIHNQNEMASNWEEIIPKLKNENYFNDTFNELSQFGVTSENIIKAINIYEQSLITPNSPIDRFLLGDETAINQQQKRGLELFLNYGCSTCHQGINIGGNIYQKLGRLDMVPEVLKKDFGRYQVTSLESDKFIFKVPTLRNIADTAPYFHNGGVDNLSDAVQIMARSQLARELTSSEVDDIVALLQSFSSKLIEIE